MERYGVTHNKINKLQLEHRTQNKTNVCDLLLTIGTLTMDHRTPDKIFSNYDEDLSFKLSSSSSSASETASSSSNSDKISECDMIYTNSPSRQYAPTISVRQTIAGSSVPYLQLLKHLDPNNMG